MYQDEHIESAKVREEEFDKNSELVKTLFKSANKKSVCG